MENDNSKIMTVSFVSAAIVTYLVVQVLFEALAATFGSVASIRSIDAVKHGLPVGLAFLTFASLQFNPKVRFWADEVILETRKVVWPTQKDTTTMTTVVCIMLLLAGLVLGAFDFVSGQVIKVLLN